MVAGIQPISVSCNSKQITPAMGLPMVKKVSHGKNKLISKRIGFLVSFKVLQLYRQYENIALLFTFAKAWCRLHAKPCVIDPLAKRDGFDFRDVSMRRIDQAISFFWHNY